MKTDILGRRQMKLSDQVAVKQRFARSANVERDLSTAAIEGYLLTGRALDVVARVGRGLLIPSAGRALAITGPHGAGKSSLAVFLNALFAPPNSEEYETAHGVLRGADSDVAAVFTRGLEAVDSEGRGAVRAFATANHEPVTVTVARALYFGAVRALGQAQTAVPEAFADEEAARAVSAREIRDVVSGLCRRRPLVLLIDEFGKNLEAFATSGREGDPYLLQLLAETAQGESAWPLFIITMQHLAFDEYAQDTSVARRREWAKVQGRFQDIPYIETPREAWRLIGAAVKTSPGALAGAVSQWYKDNLSMFADAGLRDVWASAQGCYPLDPLAVAVLPELCARYGQNERTLFSFMAGAEPLAVSAFLDATAWNPADELPFVGLNNVYDYFLDSATASISVSATVSRWLEIETRIRDTVGLGHEQLCVLKSIGVLNLVSSAGTLRASRRMLELATIHAGSGLARVGDLAAVLESLEAAGLITYRDFADEYRIWQGSDFDLEGVVTTARRACRDRSLADLLNEAAALEPAVAGRHSQRTGVLRIFERQFSDLRTDDLAPPEVGEPWDGKVLYATVTVPPEVQESGERDKPVLIVVPGTLDAIRDVAVEAAALRVALSSAEAGDADWVARRELIERAADAEKALRHRVANTWGPADSTWYLHGRIAPLQAHGGVSATLSQAADLAYSSTPRVANEMIARRELTSQGAKARRMLLEAFIKNPSKERFGIEGYGPERAIYEAVYRATGLHQPDKGAGNWIITKPKRKHWARVWAEIEAAVQEAKERRINLADIADRLKRPPIGLKDGILPILLLTALALRANEVALYEHGSLVLGLDDAVAERMARNPGHFAIKNNATDTGARKLVVEALAERLGITTNSAHPTFLGVARVLYRELQLLPPFTLQTRRHVSKEAVGVLQAFRTAPEPDSLIFETLPVILDCPLFSATGTTARKDAHAFAARLTEVFGDLRAAYGRLIDQVWRQLAEATGVWGERAEIRARLAAQATALHDRVLEPRLNAFVGALGRSLDDDDVWAENVAMVVADGQAPRTWTDELAARFALQIADLGGAFRRVQALLYDRLAVSDDAYRSRRLTLTRPDGEETSQVLVLSERERTLVSTHLGPLLEELSEIFGSRAAARQTLLAHLATDDEAVDDAGAIESVAKEA
jgi:hypothetical protein